MSIVLYAMLALNLLMGTLAYCNGDQAQVKHAVLFATVACVGLALSWLAAWESR